MKYVCPRDCSQRRVGCRSSCSDWQAHERRKAERYAAKAQEYSSYPSSDTKERQFRKKLRRHL